MPLLAATCLVACGPQADNGPAEHDGGPGAPAAADDAEFQMKLEGSWRIRFIDREGPAAANTETAAKPASLTFSQTGYGGTVGCNHLGGIGVLQGGRYYAMPGPQTVMACTPRLLRDETRLDALMRAAPRVERSRDGGLVLDGGGQVLALERMGDAPAGPTVPVRAVDGMAFEISVVNGAWVGREATDTIVLTFAADEWHINLPCGMVGGVWKQVDRTLALVSPARPGEACDSGDRDLDGAIRTMLAVPLRVSIGVNGEFVMAGEGLWMSGWGRDASQDVSR